MKIKGLLKPLLLVLVLSAALVLTACDEKACYHIYDDNGKCILCGESTNLKFNLVQNDTAYAVVGVHDTTVTEIQIPAEYNGKPVIAIEFKAFQQCLSLTSVTIPDSVTSIGDRAFRNCVSLTSITIPDSVTSIGDDAFYSCSSLTSVTIGNGVASIGSSAFSDCSSLNAVYITDIAKWCAIDFGNYPANPLRYAKNLYLNGELVTDLVIPDSVTSIASLAFSGCTSLTSVTIPDSVTSISDDAFSGCYNLKAVYITDIAKWCAIGFYDYDSNPLRHAKNLYLNGELVTDLVIPDGVTRIGYLAFSNCSSLTSVTIPDSVTRIVGSAFQNCSSLNSINIPDSVTYISDEAFMDCSSLSSLTIGNGVTSIGGSAFQNCSSLTSINIPDSVTSIGWRAFYGCTSLTSVIIPESVTRIGEYAFYGCSKLTIYAEAPAKFSGWNSDWNSSNRPVIWGYTGE